MSSRSEREVAGYVKALNYIYDNFEELDVSEKTIRELHQLLTSELTEGQLPSTQRGAYKNVPNDVVEQDQVTGRIIKVWFKTALPGLETETAMSGSSNLMVGKHSRQRLTAKFQRSFLNFR